MGKILDNFCELFVKTYGPCLPTPKSKREEFLGKVREKVSYYQPRIEDKCNIGLGKIEVKDNKEWLSDFYRHRYLMQACEFAWEMGRIPTKMDFRSTFLISSFAKAILTIPIAVYNSSSGADFRCFNNSIYVPFYYMNRSLETFHPGRR